MAHEISDRRATGLRRRPRDRLQRFRERYNASCILFDNLAKGFGERLALTGPAGTRTYAELCAEACRWGHGFLSLGLKRGDRVLLFLDDTPAYPAAFFGAVRAGFVPLLINTLTPPDLLQFYLADTGATVAVADAEFCCALQCRGLQGHGAAHADRGQRRRRRARGAEGDRRRAMARRVFRASWPKPTRIATRWRSGCIRPARPAGPRASCICSTTWPIATWRLRENVLKLSARRHLLLGAEDLLRLWLRQFRHLSVLGGRRHAAAAGPAKTGLDLRGDRALQADASSSACRRSIRR